MTHATTPGLAYQAVKAIGDNSNYKKEMERKIRHVAEYNDKQKGEAGIAYGKVDALKFFNYLNAHVVRPLLRGKNFDSNDAGFIGNWVQFKTLVTRYGHDLDELLPRLAALYGQTSTQYLSSKDVQYSGTIPLDESRPGVETLAGISGQKYQLAKAIKDIKEPTDAQTVKGEIEPNLVRAVEEATSVGSLEAILKEAQGTGTPK